METENITETGQVAEDMTADFPAEPFPTEEETDTEAAEPAAAPSPDAGAEEAAVTPSPEPSPKSAPVSLVDEFRRLERINEEYLSFRSLFPDMKLSELPDEVEKSISAGVPLDAACALHRVRREAAEKKASAVNESNKKLSSGAVRSSAVNYLTIEEIGAMSQGEVRKNLGFILRSLEKQNKNRKE